MHIGVDLATLLLDIESSDQVILPSYLCIDCELIGFAWRRFRVVGIREDSLNLDERLMKTRLRH